MAGTGHHTGRAGSKQAATDMLTWEQSLGWEHYEVHEPEPHILLFKYVALLQISRAAC
jgi:hypothetical protein